MQDAGDEAANAQFAKAMALTGAEFLDCVDYITRVSCTGIVRPLLSPMTLQRRCAPQRWTSELRSLVVDSMGALLFGL